jgi:hypothetical protein
MKDRSRFISSVIVSLLAGFIYYQFGDDINEKLQHSMKAVLSSNDLEVSGDCDFPTFNSLMTHSSGKEINKKAKFFIKRHAVEYKKNGTTIPADKEFSEFVISQAQNKKPVADRNIDFTAELENLIKDDAGKTPVPGKQLKIETARGHDADEIADTKELRIRVNLLHKDLENIVGNGFEYNYMIEGSAAPKPETESKEPAAVEPESQSGCTYEKSKTTYSKSYKVKIKCPKGKSNGDMDNDNAIEIDIDNDSSDGDTM